MSALAGILHLDGRPVSRDLLSQMIDCVPHRSPDGTALWVAGNVGLAHGRFCTTKESLGESQPTSDPGGRLHVTLDGRIDNREDLIRKLGLDSAPSRNPTDVELFLLAWQKWEADAPREIVGDFAFGLWDSGRRRLYCGRDTYGIRPFYYHFDGRNLYFASEIAQLSRVPSLSLEVEERKIAEMFTRGGKTSAQYRNQHRTYFKEILELPAAHLLIAGSEPPMLRRYWDLDPEKWLHYRSQSDYFEHFRELFGEVVRSRMRSCGPVGAELSGGLDSASIVCMAHREMSEGRLPSSAHLVAFSMVFDELPCDERPFIDEVLRKTECPLELVASDPLCGLGNLPPAQDSVLRMDGPNEFHLQLALEELYRRARDRDVRVMLCGEGPEIHLYGSSFVYDSLLRRGRLLETARRLWEVSRRRGFPRGWLDAFRTLRDFGFTPLLPGGRGWRRFQEGLYSWMENPSLPVWLSPPFRALVLEVVAEQRERVLKLRRFPEWGRQAEYESLNFASPLLSSHFPIPVERRFPYFDRRIVEFAFSVPPEVKFQPSSRILTGYGNSKRLLREAMKGLLPEAIRTNHKKVLFNEVLLRRYEENRQALRSFFAPPSRSRVAALGCVDSEALWEEMDRLLGSLSDVQGLRTPMATWTDQVTRLEIWLQTLNKATPAPESTRV